MRILMVCLGNICRSPLAEGILKHKAALAGLQFTIDSAGTNGIHVGEAPHHLSQKVAKKHGLDIGSQVARKFIKQDMHHYDKIYVMARDVMEDVKQISGSDFDPGKVDYFLNILYPSQNKDVPDPWYGDEDGYDEVYDLIDATCTKLIEQSLVSPKMQNI